MAETGPTGLRLSAHRNTENGARVPADASLATIGPETIGQLNLFAHKVVLALYFNHFRRGLPAKGLVCAYWRTKEDFARDGVPKIFFDMFPNYGTISQGRRDEQRTFEYLYVTGTEEGVFGCLARFRQGFFAYGFHGWTTPVFCPRNIKQTG
jgi:hypothetical protein